MSSAGQAAVPKTRWGSSASVVEQLDDGDLERLIDEDGISGVTSNPTIFERAMGDSDRYDDAFRELRGVDDPQRVFEMLAYRDVREPTRLAPRPRRAA